MGEDVIDEYYNLDPIKCMNTILQKEKRKKNFKWLENIDGTLGIQKRACMSLNYPNFSNYLLIIVVHSRKLFCPVA